MLLHIMVFLLNFELAKAKGLFGWLLVFVFGGGFCVCVLYTTNDKNKIGN